MHIIPIILGIFLELEGVCSSTGVIDFSDTRYTEIFTGPTVIGDAKFYKYTCDDNGSHSDVFDGGFRFFPIRSHTRLVNIVLACKGLNAELVQVMYSDVKKDYRLNSLYYRKIDGTWRLIDGPTYKTELFKLKNNHVSFDILKTSNKGFKQVKSTLVDGFNSYILEKGYEVDHIYNGNTLIWDNDPNYNFKSLDILQSSDRPDRLRIQYGNYFANVSKHFSKSEGWIFDAGRRVIDLLSLYSHGCEFSESSEDVKWDGNSPDLLFEKVPEDFESEALTFSLSDLCDLDSKDPLSNFNFNVNFDKGKFHYLTVNQYLSYEVNSYEFTGLSGCRLSSVTEGDLVLWDFSPENAEEFHDLKFSYVPENPILAVALTSIKRVNVKCDHPHDYPEDASTTSEEGDSQSKNRHRNTSCTEPPYVLNHTFHKRVDGTWYSIERRQYYGILNEMIRIGTEISMRKRLENPYVTPQITPSTPNIDYGNHETFTYDINNPLDNNIEMKLVLSDPDLIRLTPKKGLVLNVVVDQDTILWEQRESGLGCLLIYIYRSDNLLMSHFYLHSKSEQHLYFRHDKKKWYKIEKEQYETLRKDKGFLSFLRFFKRDKNVNEYKLPPDTFERYDLNSFKNKSNTDDSEVHESGLNNLTYINTSELLKS